MARSKVELKYNHKGFVAHIPARDLTAKEVREFGREYLLSLGIYEETPKQVDINKREVENE